MSNSYQTIYVIVTGFRYSGKTEFMRAVSEIDIVSTQLNGYPPADFGRMTIEQNLIGFLFGLFPTTIRLWREKGTTPRKKRQGCIITIDSSKINDMEWGKEQVHDWLLKLEMPVIIAATKQDRDNALPPDELRELYAIPDEIPIYPVSATTDPDSVMRAIIGLLEIMPQDEIIQRAIIGLRKLELGRSS